MRVIDESSARHVTMDNLQTTIQAEIEPLRDDQAAIRTDVDAIRTEQERLGDEQTAIRTEQERLRNEQTEFRGDMNTRFAEFKGAVIAEIKEMENRLLVGIWKALSVVVGIIVGIVTIAMTLLTIFT